MTEHKAGCEGCRNSEPMAMDFTMAFHPIVDLAAGKVWGYEALIRGTGGQSAFEVLSQVTDKNRYSFDQQARVRAIELAGSVFPPEEDTRLSINFLPNAVYEPMACIKASLAAAARVGFNPRRIMLEFTENEKLDSNHVKRIIDAYRQIGFITAIDDFGAGYSGLGLLAKFQPDLVKIDMDLVRDISTSHARQAIVAAIVSIGRALNVTVLAEGVETVEEIACLRAAGINLFQGWFFAKPAAGRLPEIQGLDKALAARFAA